MSRIADKYKSLKEAKAAFKDNDSKLLVGACKKHLRDWLIGESLEGRLCSYLKIKRRKVYVLSNESGYYLVFANNNLRRVLSASLFGRKVNIICIREYNVDDMISTDFKLND